MLLNCVVGKEAWESLGLQGDPTSPSQRRSVLDVLWKDILKLKLQYFGHLMQRADSFEKTLMLGKIEGRRRTGWQRMRWLNGITDSMDMGLVDCSSWWWTGRPSMLRFVGSQRVGQDWATELNWTDLLLSLCKYVCTYVNNWNFYKRYRGIVDDNQSLSQV